MAPNITVFELNFDGARFGPVFGTPAEEPAVESMEATDEAPETDSSGPRGAVLLAVLGTMAAASILGVRAVRTFRSDRDAERIDGETAHVEIADGEADLSVEQ